MSEDVRFRLFGFAFLFLGILACAHVVWIISRPYPGQTSTALENLGKVWLVGEAASALGLLVSGAFLLFG
jgi:hypothetical protein